MSDPASADTREGHKRQVSLTVSTAGPTEWMMRRVDGAIGKTYYSHRMSVEEPVFANTVRTRAPTRFKSRASQKCKANGGCTCMVHG
ncbi:MAG: transposase [Haliea sp.]|nr:transposase [Haliea sp.]